MTIQTEMNATLLAKVRARAERINEHAIVAYWGKDEFHLRHLDQAFRELAVVLGYRVEDVEEPLSTNWHAHCGSLLAVIEYMTEATGEGPDEEDAAMVTQIEEEWKAEPAQPTLSTDDGTEAQEGK